MGNQNYLNSSGVILEAGDIELGAVELKDADTDTRVNIKTNSHTNNNELLINLEGYICEDNSTSTSLDADDIFIGDWKDTLDYNTITIGINADQDSAVDGLMVEWSHDGTIIDDNDVFTILANKSKVFTFSPARRYFRIKYTNGNIAQTTFNIQSILKRGGFKPSSHRIKDSIVADDDAELLKSVITGERDDGVFDNATLSNSNRLRVVSQPYTYSISEGDLADHLPIRRFGHNDNVGTSWETIDHTSNLYINLTSAEILKINSTSNSDSITGIGAQSIFITGLDSDYNLQSETVNLNGTTSVNTTKSYLRVLNMYNSSVGTSETNIGQIRLYNNALTNILYQIEVGLGRGHFAIYTVPAGYTAYITSWYGSENSSKGTYIGLFSRVFGDGGWQLIRLNIVIDNTFNTPIEFPLMFPEKTDIQLRAKSNLGGADVSAGFYGWMEKNN